jgi:hypothetical protein
MHFVASFQIKQQSTKRLPSKEDWEVARCLVETMKDVIGSITMNKKNGSNWLLSDAIVDFIHVYLQ